ncbi:type IV pilin N-terminal domain-containing protein [Halosegnis marinus]|uniref:Type IV pilin N-terminal domain-containing protein n=1 Tax=Halosegnis marinus TaxID=3034023 RepID=A0ABD5ZTK5_9EURY|nr:type IV pilin N-terminal domain-containing protein [Halosegnis sp. DT85]
MPSRRALIAALPAVALAGCTGTTTTDAPAEATATATGTATDTPTATPSLPTGLEPTADGVAVDLGAMAAGSLAVEGTTVTYTDPVETRWVTSAVRDGTSIDDPATSDRLRAAGPIPLDGVPAARLLPVFDGTRFEYRLYANAAFRDLADWRTVLARPTDSGTERAYEAATAFESVPGTDLGVAVVSNADATGGVGATEPLLPAVTNYGYDALTSGTPDDITGLLLSRRAVSTGPDAPRANFSFEYADGSVTITHEGGENIDAKRLTVTVDGAPADASFSGTVSAGDSVTVSGVGSGDVLELVWRADGESVVVARFEAP